MNKLFFATAFAALLLFSAQAACAAPLAYAIEVTDTNFLPSTIYAGNYVSIKIDVYNKNSSDPVTDVNAVIDAGNEFEIIRGTDSIDKISQRTTKALLFKLKAKEGTLPGYYPAIVSIDYRTGNMDSKETHTVQIPVSMAGKNLDIRLSPNVINPGKQTEIIFTLSNISESPVSNISFSWSEENGLVLPLGSDNKRHVSSLEAGKNAIVSYLVAADPNIEPGIYPLDLTATFSDADGIKTNTSEVGLIIGGGTSFEVSAEMASSSQLSVSIANVGSNNAGAVVVKIPGQEGIKVSGSNASILGNLNEGDYTIASFSVAGASAGTFSGLGETRRGPGSFQAGEKTQPENTETVPVQETPQIRGAGGEKIQQAAAEPRTVAIEIDYTDTTGERQSIQKTVEIDFDFSSMQSGFSESRATSKFDLMDYWLYIAGAAVAGAIIIYFKKKK